MTRKKVTKIGNCPLDLCEVIDELYWSSGVVGEKPDFASVFFCFFFALGFEVPGSMDVEMLPK